MAEVKRPARLITKMTAAPMPAEVFKLRETPRKGQMPKMRLKTKLLTRMAPTINEKYSFNGNTPEMSEI